MTTSQAHAGNVLGLYAVTIHVTHGWTTDESISHFASKDHNTTGSQLSFLPSPYIATTRRLPLTADLMSEFHKFPFLPWEIRDKIWNFARHRKPCTYRHGNAHFFRIYNVKDKTDPSHLENDVHPSSGIPEYVRFAAPRWFSKDDTQPSFELLSTRPTSWTENNPSMYLADSGLWTACHESRRVMERRSGMQMVLDHDSGDARLVNIDLRRTWRLTRSVMRIPSPSSHFYIPEIWDGVFVLQPDNMKTIPWSDVFKHMRYARIAFDYNPEWEKNPEESMDTLVEVMIQARLMDITHWYLIDYRIRRKHWAPTPVEMGPGCFPCWTYFGNGWKFEFANLISKPRARDETGLNWEDRFESYGGMYSADDFAEGVLDRFFEREEFEEGSSDGEQEGRCTTLHVLACERDPVDGCENGIWCRPGV
jgi:hypothetical protein